MSKYFSAFKTLGTVLKGNKSKVPDTITSIKPKVNKTTLDTAKSKLAIQQQKTKASAAKLKQTLFESKNKAFKGDDFTFGKSSKKSESNKERYKRVQGENTKVLKSMLDKAVENKKDGGRMGYKVGGRIGLKHGSYETVPPSKGFSEYVTKEKQKKIDAANKKANEKDKPGGAGPMGRAAVKVGGRIGRKFGSSNPRKTNVQKINETFGPKKKVPSKFKGFSKLPEKVQQKIDAKLAKKV